MAIDAMLLRLHFLLLSNAMCDDSTSWSTFSNICKVKTKFMSYVWLNRNRQVYPDIKLNRPSLN